MEMINGDGVVSVVARHTLLATTTTTNVPAVIRAVCVVGAAAARDVPLGL
jgi:hypothetical protein